MSPQKDLLREIAAAINTGSAFRNTEWFADKFRLHQPPAPSLPDGYAGANQILERARRLGPPINFEILDMVAEGDRIALRWQVTATYDDKPFEESIIAIYRFEQGRIAEDWGIAIRALWP